MLKKILITPPQLILWLCFLACACSSGDNQQQLNGVKLASTLDEWRSEVYLYDGSEEFYKDYPTIRQSLLDNLQRGIKQGVYEGESKLYWNQYKARQLRMTFYQNQLYQVQWDFSAFEDIDINELSAFLLGRLRKVYGEPQKMEYPDFTIWSWQHSAYYLSIFQESDLELTVEFRGPKSISEL